MDYVVIDRLLDAWGRGDRDSLDQLMGLVYHELHRTASALLRGEATNNRTSPTSLVNSLYLELERQGRLQARDQRHFFAIAAYLMRQILVANARRRCAEKRGANLQLLSLSSEIHEPFAWHDHPETLLALEDALLRLEQLDPLKASIVDLRFFADLSIAATAEALSLSPATVKRQWAVARLWLLQQLSGAEGA
jgi:RNA polymerase sigma factor (TIGR02999 family)